jgi:pullulanase
MFDRTWQARLGLLLATSVVLSACGGGSDSDDVPPLQCVAPKVVNEAGNACIDPIQTPVNTAPTISSATSFSVAEQSTDGSEVYTAQASDAEGDQITWSLTDSVGIFTIDAATGVITVSQSSAIVASQLTNYSITVTATDNGSPAMSSSITISVTVTPPIVNYPIPSITPTDSQGIVYYYRPDGEYTGFTLHAWNNDTCNGYAQFAEPGEAGAGTDWTAGLEPTGTDDNYGAYWLFETKTGATCANFIVHKGDTKDPEADQQLPLSNDRWAFVISDVGVFTNPAEISFDVPFKIENASAHWVNENTIVWNGSGDNVKLHWSQAGTLDQDITSGQSVSLTSTAFPASLNDVVPHLKDWSAYTFTVTAEQQLDLVKSQLVLVSYDTSDEPIDATYVQFAKAFDAIYTSGNDDADEVTDYGVTYDAQGNISVKVWAPSAHSLDIAIYDANKAKVATHAMTENTATGVWSYTADSSLNYDRLYYRFEIEVYHPLTKKVETTWSTDPYSVNTSTNGRYSQFVNLTDADLYPEGWEDHTIPTIERVEQGVLLEAHIRDFSIRDNTTSAANRGKYMAFTEANTDATNYLAELATAGVTHFHMLPANDIATIEEDESRRIELTNTVGELCARNSSSPVCGVESNSATILSVLQSYDPATDKAKELVESMRGLDGFNWGYDPHHFNVIEGSYSSDPDGVARIKEFRAMVKALHDLEMRVVLDVVYNHTSSSGLYDNSVFDKVVPGYYHRYNEVSGDIERSTCCENTATEHKMMYKFVVDSLVHWAEHLGMDGFRFDVMGHLPAQLLIDGRAAVAKVDADTYFYGEGWNLGEVSNDRLFVQATQYNLADTEIGSFNDRPRDTIRAQALTKASPDLNGIDHIRLGLAGTLQNYELEDKSGNTKKGINFSQSSYALDPADIINYVSKHDNETLYDALQYSFDASTSAETRTRVHVLNSAVPVLSQGLPFFQLGVDLMRSKSMDRNTYDAGDWYNHVDYTKASNNWNVGLPIERSDSYNTSLSANANAAVSATNIELSSAMFKELLTIRTSSPLFSLATEADVIKRVGFHNTGSDQTPGLIVMSINDGIGLTDMDDSTNALVVVFNGTASTQSHTVKTATGFTLHSVLQSSADTLVRTSAFGEEDVDGTAMGTFTVPAHTVAVFTQLQAGAQGVGLGTDPDQVLSPYGDTVVGIADITADSFSEFSYDGKGNYTGSVTLQPGDYEFNIADVAKATVNLGFADVSIAADSLTLVAGSTQNFALSVSQAASYNFVLNVATATPELSVTLGNVLVSCTLPDASEAAPFSVVGDGHLYVRGDHSGWNAEETYKMSYKGSNTYQAVAEFAGDINFKLASSDGSWTTQLWAQNDDGSIITDSLAVGTTYNVAYKNAGTDNNSTSLAQGTYSFTLTLNEADPAQGDNVGSLLIQQCN